MAFVVMDGQGISSNIMSVSARIAIAIGTMVDAVIIMIENAHKHLEHDGGKRPPLEIIRDASIEVGPALFYSLLVITVSFIPVFTLELKGPFCSSRSPLRRPTPCRGRAALDHAGPRADGLFHSRAPPAGGEESHQPISDLALSPVHRLRHQASVGRDRRRCHRGGMGVPAVELAGDPASEYGPAKNLAARLGKAFPFQNLGSEFMPPLYEGDILYMPTMFPGVSPTKAREILQQTDRIIKTFPEVAHVFGKIGRAESATDPAPFDMVETTIMLKDEKEWPNVRILDESGKVVAYRRRTPDELVSAMNGAIQFPGLSNAWTMPIKTRIDMLATGIKTPVGIKNFRPGPCGTRTNRRGGRGGRASGAKHGQRLRRARDGGNYIEFHIDRH